MFYCLNLVRKTFLFTNERTRKKRRKKINRKSECENSVSCNQYKHPKANRNISSSKASTAEQEEKRNTDKGKVTGGNRYRDPVSRYHEKMT